MNNWKIPFPRGNVKQKLFQSGLIAKINIASSWNSDQMTGEIHNLFKKKFETPQSHSFGFVYLTTFPGLRVLTKPKVNKDFYWDASAVLSLHRTTIHILSNMAHKDFNEEEESLNTNLVQVRLLH